MEEKKIDVGRSTAGPVMPVVVPIKIPTKGRGFWYKVGQAFKRRQWQLIRDWEYWSPALNSWILVPAPFDFDFASVPRIFWTFLDPVGLLLMGSIPHDFGYRYGGMFLREPIDQHYRFIDMTRVQVDTIFRTVVDEVNEMTVMANIGYYAVRIGGIGPWDKARRFGLNATHDYPGIV